MASAFPAAGDRGRGGGGGEGGGGYDGGGSRREDPDDPFDPPKTPLMVLRDNPGGEDELSPDTENNVVEQTDGIFRNFVFYMQTLGRRGWMGRGWASSDSDGADGDGVDVPLNLPELTAFVDQPLS